MGRRNGREVVGRWEEGKSDKCEGSRECGNSSKREKGGREIWEVLTWRNAVSKRAGEGDHWSVDMKGGRQQKGMRVGLRKEGREEGRRVGW